MTLATADISNLIVTDSILSYDGQVLRLGIQAYCSRMRRPTMMVASGARIGDSIDRDLEAAE